jgi:hypothetical protein
VVNFCSDSSTKAKLLTAQNMPAEYYDKPWPKPQAGGRVWDVEVSKFYKGTKDATIICL